MISYESTLKVTTLVVETQGLSNEGLPIQSFVSIPNIKLEAPISEQFNKDIFAVVEAMFGLSEDQVISLYLVQDFALTHK